MSIISDSCSVLCMMQFKVSVSIIERLELVPASAMRWPDKDGRIIEIVPGNFVTRVALLGGSEILKLCNSEFSPPG